MSYHGTHLPLRLLSLTNGELEVISPRAHGVREFDIVTYTWGDAVDPYRCNIPGTNWNVSINPRKLTDVKRLMIAAKIKYLWMDCVCLNQDDKDEMDAEVLKMYEYYKSASKCYILMELDVVWNPQAIVENLKFLDHILSTIGGAALASEVKALSGSIIEQLASWAETDWIFPLDSSIVRSAGIDMGVLNCYSTCVDQVRALFENPYFTRVWTFQEMILGKNITMYGINEEHIECIGELDVWMDLATESKDKALKLKDWIALPRRLNTSTINTILNIVEENLVDLNILQTQAKGVMSARTDIINGGPLWWLENHRGISNIFSAISITPRKCTKRKDLFRGVLGIFDGLFTKEEVESDFTGDDIERMTFAFFKQLSIKTSNAWTKLAITSEERGELDWIPVITNHDKVLTTDIYAGVVHLGRLKSKGLAKAFATTGIIGAPKSYMKIQLHEDNRGWQFNFRGCNAGKKVSTGWFGSEPIPVVDHVHDVAGDETGRILVQCATIMGSLLDPGQSWIAFRRRMLDKLQPHWEFTDPNAKPIGWEDRCVSGTGWGELDPDLFRVHNRSMNCRLGAISGCASRLQNETTAGISCEIRVNCGCVMRGPFSLMFEGITAVHNSSLGGISVTLDQQDRITLSDGLGLVQVSDSKTFKLIATGGDIDYHKDYATRCRKVKNHKPVYTQKKIPQGRALVREEFTHGIADAMRDYAYVDFTVKTMRDTDVVRGPGNLFLCRNHVVAPYRIIGVCIDNVIANKGGRSEVTIR